jgi:3-oxoacyl-[acyl-carrier protein] reductase
MPGKVALVTGSSRGIGRAVALELARLGYRVAVNYRKRVDEAKATVAAIREAGGYAEAFRADVSKPGEVESLFKAVEESMGVVDVLVNNAGWGLLAPLPMLDEELWDRHVRINLSSVYYCTRRALPGMVRKGWGRIINMSSLAGINGIPGLAAYSAAKAGIIGLTRALAQELRGTGITVNAVAPGFIETDMTENLPEDIKEGFMSQIPMSRFGRPEDVANVILFLASDLSGYITGEVIHVNGGLF